jgi:hypothetical protein
MKKKTTYLIRVHEKEFKQIKENSPLLRRLTRLQKKRQKYYAARNKNAAKRKKKHVAYQNKLHEQLLAAEFLGEIMEKRRPKNNTEDLAEKKYVFYNAYGHLYYTRMFEHLLNVVMRPQGDGPSCCSFRQERILAAVGFSCVNDFRRVTPDEIRALPGIGETTVKWLIDCLQRRGVTLGDLVPQKEKTWQQKQKSQNRPSKT